MIKLFATILSAFSLFWVGLGAGVWYEGFRPAGWPNVHVKVGFLHWTLHLPDTPAIQLATLQAGEKKAGIRTVYIVKTQKAVTVQAAADERVAQDHIRTITNTIIREIPAHVTPATDLTYPLPVGLVRIYDASALGVDVSAVPDPAGRTDGSPSEVTASAAASVFASNNGVCSAALERATAWAKWAGAQAAIDQNTPEGR